MPEYGYDPGFWMGDRYRPDPADAQMQGGEEMRGQLSTLQQQIGGGGAFRDEQLAALRRQAAIASGDQMGAGELGAQRAAQRGMARTQSMAQGARGFGAAAARQQAMNQIAQQQTQAAGQQQQAAMADQARAQQALAQMTQAGRAGDISQYQAQMAALAAQMGISQAELQARMQMQGLQAQMASADVGMLPGLMQMGGQLGAAAIGAG
jgi:hypothetical protein